MDTIQKQVSAGCFILCCIARTKVQNPGNVFNKYVQNTNLNETCQTLFTLCVVEEHNKTVIAVKSQAHFIWSLMKQSYLSLCHPQPLQSILKHSTQK